jgi:hypothetical protein
MTIQWLSREDRTQFIVEWLTPNYTLYRAFTQQRNWVALPIAGESAKEMRKDFDRKWEWYEALYESE